MGTKPARFALSFGPQVVVVNKELDPGDENDFAITKNNKGQLVVSLKPDATNFKPFWQETVEILRILPSTGTVEVKVEGSDSNQLTLKTVTNAEPFVGSMFLSGRENVFFEFSGELQLLVRVAKRSM